jgi:hypothetical protein
MAPELILLCIAAFLLIAAVLVLPGRMRSVESNGPQSGRTRATGRRLTVFEAKAQWVLLLVLPPVVLAGFAGIHWLESSDRENESRARQSILDMVATSPAVRMNGERLDDVTVLLDALRLIGDVPAHHSSPTAFVRIELSKGTEVVNLEIARDSDRPAEFWVYRSGPNRHGDPRGQYSGRFTSLELTGYLSHHVP